jgi:hypothetical protein
MTCVISTRQLKGGLHAEVDGWNYLGMLTTDSPGSWMILFRQTNGSDVTLFILITRTVEIVKFMASLISIRKRTAK